MQGGNFRTSYYSHLGFKKPIAIASEIETLLQQNPISLSSICQVCRRSDIPATLRPLIWRLLLRIWSPFKNDWEFIHEQRKSQYEDISRASSIIDDQKFKIQKEQSSVTKRSSSDSELNNNNSERSSLLNRANHIVRLYHIQSNLDENCCSFRSTGGYTKRNFCDLAKIFCEVNGDDDIYSFWCLYLFLSKRVFSSINKDENYIDNQINTLQRIFVRCDKRKIFDHLLGINKELVLIKKWFRSFLTSHFDKRIVIRLIDHELVTSLDFVPYFVYAILTYDPTICDRIMESTKESDLELIVKYNLDPDDIVNIALDVYSLINVNEDLKNNTIILTSSMGE